MSEADHLRKLHAQGLTDREMGAILYPQFRPAYGAIRAALARKALGLASNWAHPRQKAVRDRNLWQRGRAR